MPTYDLTGVEVHGQDILSFVDALGAFSSLGHRILQDLKIGTLSRPGGYQILPGNWYPLVDKIRILQAVKERVGPATLRLVGEKIPANALFPPAITDIHKAMASIDVAYHMNHRKHGRALYDEKSKTITEGIGHYGYRVGPGTNHIISVCDSPNPSEYDEGILHAMARRFEPTAQIFLDPTLPTRREGADSCTFVVTW